MAEAARDYTYRQAAPGAAASDEKDTRKTQAYYALCLHPDLTAAAKAVGAALVDHCNLTTMRCDPSIAGLAAHAGISRASVFRALTDLAGCGLIVRLRHASGGHRNAYVIQWAALTTESARARTAAEAASGGLTMRPSQGCDPQGLRGETETVARVRPKPLKEPWKKTCSESETVAPARGQSRPPPAAPPAQRHMMLPIPGGKRHAAERTETPQASKGARGETPSPERPNRYRPKPGGGYLPSSAEVAREAAAARWDAALRAHLEPGEYGDAIGRIEAWMERIATRAETAERGAGLGVMLTALSLEGWTPGDGGGAAERAPPLQDTG